MIKSTNIVIYSSVTYSQLSIGIPRCNSCYKIHREAKWKSIFYYWLAIAVVVSGALEIIGAPAIIALLPAAFYATIVPAYIADKMIVAKGILTRMEGANKIELIQNLLKGGWSFQDPRQ